MRAYIPVSLSGGVEPGARTGTSVNGLPVVVWRGADGSVRAWPDRCPHRGMRLSFGFVRRNALVCIYHGWSFGLPDEAGAPGDAHCLSVPAHPGMTPPGKATIPALPVAEALGMIWVGTSQGDNQPPPAAAIGDAPADGAVLHPANQTNQTGTFLLDKRTPYGIKEKCRGYLLGQICRRSAQQNSEC